MKKMDIKVFYQKNKSSDCGPVSTQMVLNHFGKGMSLEEIKAKMTYVPGGTYIYDNGLVVLRKGLSAELVTANPLLFKQEERVSLKNEQDVLKHLNSIKRKKNSKKSAITLFQDFIKNGGRVKVQIPTIEHIVKAIDNNKLIIGLLYGGALGRREGGFHFIVVTGYKKGFVHINNPGKRSRQGWFPEKDFLYALHSSTCVDVDNGSLLIVGE
ncbi:MAG: C39 family peptidase [Candidatus Pacebacteria bacterium]|nr:C39 family peptidase [Candidatus Paceibacterota bacterium]MBP9842681.1 C39 family peptidase [Candidatus Paceibacterota bacterium]